MGIFRFTVGLIEELNKIMRDFWWGDEHERRRMHWMSWDKVTRPKSHGGMGFRDMKIFNQALLARQAWKLIKDPESLCARVLRAKYYPNSNLLDTAFIQNTSPSWQGIMHGLDLLKRGAIWRIGDGTQVRIWRDNWIPRLGSLMVSRKRGNTRLRWVSDLIIPHSRNWDEQTIRRVFYPHDAEAILAIKLTPRTTDDFIAWNAEENGLFTVRSAYRLGLQPTLDAVGPGQSSSTPLGDRPIWDCIWKAAVPQKIKVFAWKAATNTLAVLDNVHRRINTVNPSCSICGMTKEDEHHALVACTLGTALRSGLRDVWSLPPESEFKRTGDEWFLQLIANASAETRVKLLFMFWRIWHHRNNIIHGDGKASIEASVRFLQNYETSFREANSQQAGKGKALVFPSQKTEATCDNSHYWTAPPSDTIMVNVDAGWDPLSGKAGIGVMGRDSKGAALFCEWRHIPYCSSAEEAEALACLSGLKCLAVRTYPGILGTDCLRVFNAINSASPDRSPSWGIYMEIKDLLRFNPEFTVQKVDRSCNRVAHELAQLGKRESCGFLDGSAPSCVLDLIAFDCKNTV
jgi:hypothetical protein